MATDVKYEDLHALRDILEKVEAIDKYLGLPPMVLDKDQHTRLLDGYNSKYLKAIAQETYNQLLVRKTELSAIVLEKYGMRLG